MVEDLTTAESQPTLEEREDELLRLEEEYWHLRETKGEPHPQVQYVVDQFRRRLRQYEQAVGERGEG